MQDGRPISGAAKDEQDVTKGAAIGGAVMGFLWGGPLGLLIGGSLGNLAANREDGAGDVARTVGKATSVVLKKAKQIDSRYGLTDAAKETIKGAYKKVKQAQDKLADES